MKKYIPLLLILIILTFLFLFRLNRDLLGDWDECVIAEQAKEMKVSQNFITNQFDGNLLFEKPSGNNWWMQVPLLFSNSEFSYRLSSVIFSLLLISLIYIFCLNYFSLFIAVASSLLLLTNWLFVDFSTKVNTDIEFTFFTFLGFYLWILSYKKTWFSYLSGLAFGLAVLTKGLSIFPYIMAIFIWELLPHSGLRRESLKHKLIRMTEMSVIFLLTILPWHIYHYFKYGQEFITTYFIQHLINRAKYPLDFHFEGRLFYVKLILKDFNVWLAALLMVPIYLWKKSEIEHVKKKELIILIMLLIMLPFISITLVRTRIAWYALPMYPFIAIAIAFFIEKIIVAFKFRFEKYLYGLVIIVTAILSLTMINQKMRFFDDVRRISPRDEIFIKAQNLDTVEINYLVWQSERTAEAILPKEFRTNTTFMFGGNPCAVFYSDKKINYFYNIDQFINKFKIASGYYVVYKDDLNLLDGIEYQIIFDNKDYYILRR
jgi:4-amino-4-deoxy-L-arabinose transferase-like glycosyltransferase